MYPLYLHFQVVEDPSTYTGANLVNLDGQQSGEAVIQGCKILPAVSVAGAAASETITEIFELVLEGTEALITEKVQQLEQILNLAGREPIPRDWVYLRYFHTTGGESPTVFDWKSQVLSGRVELAGKGLVDRDTESQLVKLHLTRFNYWAAPKIQPAIFNAGDIDQEHLFFVPDIGSHTDADYLNQFGICGHDIPADLPSPVELCIESTAPGAHYPNFVISQRQVRGSDQLDTGFIQAEDLTSGQFVTKTTPADATCSAGHYANLEWTGDDETLLCYWSPTAADMAILRGQVHRPILRLQAANTYDDLWLNVRVHSTSTPIRDTPIQFGSFLQESLWYRVPLDTVYIELPPINIPPSLAGFESYRPVYVSINARRMAGGSSSLAVDFVQFTPAETIRRLNRLATTFPVGAGLYLFDSGILQATYYQDAGGAKELSHVSQGSYLQVIPGYDSLIRILHRPAVGEAWPLTSVFNIYPWYEPRRRNL